MIQLEIEQESLRALMSSARYPRYWILCAGDRVYANDTSIVGSIGVIAATFGLVDLIQKLGVERRVLTAGQNKAQLDPFLFALLSENPALAPPAVRF